MVKLTFRTRNELNWRAKVTETRREDRTKNTEAPDISFPRVTFCNTNIVSQLKRQPTGSGQEETKRH